VRRPLRPKVWCQWLVLPALALAGLGAGAAEPGDGEAARIARERAAIQAERDRLDAQFAAEQARCAERFAVTACLDEVRERRRAAMEGPRARALALDDAERRNRAAARREAVAQKQRRAADSSPPADVPVSAPGLAAPALAPSPSLPRVRPEDATASRAAAASAADAAAAQRAAAARKRQAAIDAEQARVASRLAERARQGKAAAPLPLPASAPKAKPPATPGSAAR